MSIYNIPNPYGTLTSKDKATTTDLETNDTKYMTPATTKDMIDKNSSSGDNNSSSTVITNTTPTLVHGYSFPNGTGELIDDGVVEDYTYQYTFDIAFKNIPVLVSQVLNYTGMVILSDITSTGFRYRVVDLDVTTTNGGVKNYVVIVNNTYESRVSATYLTGAFNGAGDSSTEIIINIIAYGE